VRGTGTPAVQPGGEVVREIELWGTTPAVVSKRQTPHRAWVTYILITVIFPQFFFFFLEKLLYLETPSQPSNPLQCSCLENPRDEGAWWAAIYGVARSDTTEVLAAAAAASLLKANDQTRLLVSAVSLQG